MKTSLSLARRPSFPGPLFFFPAWPLASPAELPLPSPFPARQPFSTFFTRPIPRWPALLGLPCACLRTAPHAHAARFGLHPRVAPQRLCRTHSRPALSVRHPHALFPSPSLRFWPRPSAPFPFFPDAFLSFPVRLLPFLVPSMARPCKACGRRRPRMAGDQPARSLPFSCASARL